MELKQYIVTRRDAVNGFLAAYMEREEAKNAVLLDAMKHTLFSSGKRLRPVLTIASAEIFGVPMARVMPTACALELIHTYSMIHDDLPCMDNDDFRRGKPTSHKVFGEAMAVLAGDALLTAAFALIAENGQVVGVTAGQIVEVVSDIAQAAGAPGMVGGQAIDMESVGVELSLEQIETLDRLKTGALITVAARVGAVLAGASRADIDSLTQYGQCLGIAYQISDDVLNAVGDEAKMGKRLRKDEEQGKNSFVRVLGADGARERAGQYIEEAKSALARFGERASVLTELADFVIRRES